MEISEEPGQDPVPDPPHRAKESNITSNGTTVSGSSETIAECSGGADGSAGSFHCSLTFDDQLEELKENCKRACDFRGVRWAGIKFDPWFEGVVEKLRVDPCLDISELGIQIPDWLPKEATSLHVAVMMGDLKMVQMILSPGCMPDKVRIDACMGERQLTVLHLAVLGGHGEIVDVLLEKGADVGLQDIVDKTALHMAVKGGHGKIVDALLEKGADVGLLHRYKQSALHLAVQGGHGKIVDVLLEEGADVGLFDIYEKSALHMAVEGGHGKIVDALLEKGADVGLLHRFKRSALHMAVEGGHGKIVDALLEKGADVGLLDMYEKSALHMAVKGGHGKIVDVLLEKGADVGLLDRYGKSALHMAVEGGHGKIVDALLKKGADAHGVTLHWLAFDRRGAREMSDIIRCLISDKSIDIKALDSKGLSAFYLAVVNCNTNLVNAFLEVKGGIQLNEACAKDLGPPIQIACEGGDDFNDIKRVLMECEPIKSYVDTLYRDRQVYVDAANAILVGAALIASVTFASWLQPPLNYTSYSGEAYSSSTLAPSASDLNYVDVEHNIPLRAFWIFNALSFYFAIGTVVFGARSVLPRSGLFIKKNVDKLAFNLLVTSMLLAFSVLFVIIAFAIAGTIVLTPLLKYQWYMIVPTIFGGLVCITTLGCLFKSMWENYFGTNIVQTRLQKRRDLLHEGGYERYKSID